MGAEAEKAGSGVEKASPGARKAGPGVEKTGPAGTDRRKFLRVAALTAVSGAVVAGGGLAVYRLVSGPRDPAEAIGELVTRTVPDGAVLSLCAAVDTAPIYEISTARPGAVHDIGSLTKQFTAAGIMALYDRGQVDPGDSLGTHLPEVGHWADITVHQLLTHTSGLMEVLGEDHEPLSREGLLAAVADTAPLSGTAPYLYSNVGYSLLAAVIETVSGDSYEGFLAEAIFGPAGMADTGYVLPDWAPARLVTEYEPDGAPRGLPTDLPWDDDGPYWNLRGNGGLLSTTHDMLAWHRALLGEEVLSARAKELMFTPHVDEGDGDSHYGYGWVLFDVKGTTVAWHNGGNGASYSEFLHVPGGGQMVFWTTNTAVREGEWNLEESDLAVRAAEILL